MGMNPGRAKWVSKDLLKYYQPKNSVSLLKLKWVNKSPYECWWMRSQKLYGEHKLSIAEEEIKKYVFAYQLSEALLEKLLHYKNGIIVSFTSLEVGAIRARKYLLSLEDVD